MGHDFYLPVTATGSIVLGLQAALPANPPFLPPSLLVDIALSQQRQLFYYSIV